jgi:hypothetical protein
MKKTFFIISAIALMVTVSCPIEAKGQNRDTRTYADAECFTLYGGTSRYATGEGAWGGALHYQSNIGSSRWMIGVQLNGAIATTPDTNATPGRRNRMVGMDATLGFRMKAGVFYIQPTVLAGVGSVVKSTALHAAETTIGEGPRARYHENWLAIEAGARIEAGAQFGWFGAGIFCQYIWQNNCYKPITTNNMVVDAEWLVATPFTAGIAASFNLDHGTRHHGGNNVSLVEGFGTYGTRGWETGAKVLWNRNTGFLVLSGKEPGLRGEFIASTEYGLRIATTLASPNLSTAQIGVGKVFHFKGPESPVLLKATLWGGLGELPVWMATSTGDNYTDGLKTIQPTIKGNAEIQVTFRVPAIRRGYLSLLGGCSYEHAAGNKVSGKAVIKAEGADKPFAVYGGVALGWSF